MKMENDEWTGVHIMLDCIKSIRSRLRTSAVKL